MLPHLHYGFQYLCRSIARSQPSTSLCAVSSLNTIPFRTRTNIKWDTTVVVEHFTPPVLQKATPENAPNPQLAHRVADPKYIYKVVREVEYTKPVEVLLLQTVEGIGRIGEVVTLPARKARMNLLLPKLAVYASPENLAKYADLVLQDTDDQPSSMHSKKTVAYLGGTLVTVCMNIHEPWILEPWHIRVAFRKANITIVHDDAIQLPPKPIQGPNLDLQNKQFYVTITVNGREKVNTRCRIHHISGDPFHKLPWTPLDFLKDPPEAIFAEDQEYLSALYKQRPPFTAYTEPQLTPEMVAQGMTTTSSPPPTDIEL